MGVSDLPSPSSPASLIKCPLLITRPQSPNGALWEKKLYLPALWMRRLEMFCRTSCEKQLQVSRAKPKKQNLDV